MGRLKRVGRVFWRACVAFVGDDAWTHGAAIAYFTGLSLAPLLILMIWASTALGSRLQDRLVDHVAELLGPQGAEVVRIVIQNADRDVDTGNLAGWFSVGALLFSATGVFARLQVALNAIWGVRVDRTLAQDFFMLVRKRLLSLGLIVSVGFLLLVSLLVSSAISAFSYEMRGVLPGAELLWRISDVVLPFAIYVLIFMSVFRYLPDADLRWRQVWLGSLVTGALFVLGKWLIGVYLGTSALGSAYGAAGSLILMLMWTYYSSLIVLFGAELTQAWVRERGERIRAEPHAAPDEGKDATSAA